MSMSSLKKGIRYGLSALLLSGAVLAAVPEPAIAQNNPGFTLWGGPGRRNELPYYLESGHRNERDRYKLRIPQKKMELAVSKFRIDYPDYYDGTFDTEEVEIRVFRTRKKYDSVEIDEVRWDPDRQTLEIYPLEPIPAGKKVEIVLDDVRNPWQGGMFFFNCYVESPGDVVAGYLGTWLLSIF